MSRTSRLEALKRDVKAYVAKEKERIDKDVAFLEAILSSRTGGRGVQAVSETQTSNGAQQDLASFLKDT